VGRGDPHRAHHDQAAARLSREGLLGSLRLSPLLDPCRLRLPPGNDDRDREYLPRATRMAPDWDPEELERMEQQLHDALSKTHREPRWDDGDLVLQSFALRNFNEYPSII